MMTTMVMVAGVHDRHDDDDRNDVDDKGNYDDVTILIL